MDAEKGSTHRERERAREREAACLTDPTRTRPTDCEDDAMSFTLPELGYTYESLEPHIDATWVFLYSTRSTANVSCPSSETDDDAADYQSMPCASSPTTGP